MEGWYKPFSFLLTLSDGTIQRTWELHREGGGGYKAHISSVYLFSCVIIKNFISDQLRPSAQNMFEQAFIRILIIQIVNSKW